MANAAGLRPSVCKRRGPVPEGLRAEGVVAPRREPEAGEELKTTWKRLPVAMLHG
jgi:hypothetical protein